MSYRKLVIVCALCGVARILAYVRNARAVATASANANTDEPFWCPGFENIGRFPKDVNGNSAGGTIIYLGTNGDGESWVLTAWHLVAPGWGLLGGGLPSQIEIAGTPYNVDTSSLVQIDGNTAAFKLLQRPPGIANLRISSRTISWAEHVTMVGTGYFAWRTRTVNGQPGVDVQYNGNYAPARWAENTNMHPYGEVSFNFKSPANGGLPDEAQALTWDSGSGIFPDDANGAVSGMIQSGINPAFLDTPFFLPLDGGGSGGNALAPVREDIIDLTGLGGVLGDTNDDGVVDLQDRLNVQNNYGASGPGVLGDTNGDNVVDLQDLLNVNNNFGSHD